MTRPRPWIPLALLGLFLAEVAAFVGVSNVIGVGSAVLAVLAMSMIGLVLVRREGLRAWRRFRARATSGDRPGAEITDGLVGLAGALLLAVPGLVTGLVGLILLVPPVRRLARLRVQTRAERRMSSAEAADVFGPRRVRVRYDHPQPDAPVVEGEVVDPAPRDVR